MKPTKSAYVLNAFFRKILLNRKKKRKVQRFAATRSWRFRSTKLSATTELDTKHKASFNH